MTEPQLITVDNVAARAAELVAKVMLESVKARGRFVVVLSGGNTPLPLFDLLVERSDLPWDKVQAFWGDERFVPPNDPDSNYGQVKTYFLDKLAIPAANIHPWPYLRGDPEAAARAYAATLTNVLGEAPRFDLTLLGLGDDGHTASLFPGATAEAGRTTVAHPEGKHVRLSLTARQLSQSRVVAFLVSGEKKREALEHTLYGPYDPERYPAQAISAQEQLLWVTDIAGIRKKGGGKQGSL